MPKPNTVCEYGCIIKCIACMSADRKAQRMHGYYGGDYYGEHDGYSEIVTHTTYTKRKSSPLQEKEIVSVQPVTIPTGKLILNKITLLEEPASPPANTSTQSCQRC